MNTPTKRLALPAVSILAVLSSLLVAGMYASAASAAPVGSIYAQISRQQALAPLPTVLLTDASPSPAAVAALMDSNPGAMVAVLVTPDGYAAVDKVDRVLWSVGGPTGGMPIVEYDQTGLNPIVVMPTPPKHIRNVVQLSALPDALRRVPHNAIVVVDGYGATQSSKAVAEVRSRYRTVPVLELYTPSAWTQRGMDAALPFVVMDLSN